jgi:hypothetical protein
MPDSHQDHPVRPPPIGGQTALPRKVQLSPKQVYKPKIIEEKVEEIDVDPERTTNQDIIQIGTMDVPVEKDCKRPVVLNDQVGTSSQKGFVATSDHEASGSGSNSRYFLPRWCPPSLTHTQRRKLQRLRLQEKKEKELEEQRDKIFKSYRPMVPQGKEWRAKTTPQAKAVKPPEETVKPPEAVKPVGQAVRPGSPETPLSFASSVPMACDNKLLSVPTLEDDEQLIDYSSSPERMDLEDN